MGMLQGCTLKCRWLHDQQPFELPLRRTTMATFVSVDGLMTTAKPDFSVYAVPISQTYAAIDSAISPCVWLQVRL